MDSIQAQEDSSEPNKGITLSASSPTSEISWEIVTSGNSQSQETCFTEFLAQSPYETVDAYGERERAENDDTNHFPDDPRESFPRTDDLFPSLSSRNSSHDAGSPIPKDKIPQSRDWRSQVDIYTSSLATQMQIANLDQEFHGIIFQRGYDEPEVPFQQIPVGVPELVQDGLHNDLTQDGAHNDLAQSGLHNDLIQCERHSEVIQGGLHNDLIQDGSHNDLIQGGLHNDLIHDGRHNDLIHDGRHSEVIQEMAAQRSATFVPPDTQSLVRILPKGDPTGRDAGQRLVYATSPPSLSDIDIAMRSRLHSWNLDTGRSVPSFGRVPIARERREHRTAISRNGGQCRRCKKGKRKVRAALPIRRSVPAKSVSV